MAESGKDRSKEAANNHDYNKTSFRHVERETKTTFSAEQRRYMARFARPILPGVLCQAYFARRILPGVFCQAYFARQILPGVFCWVNSAKRSQQVLPLRPLLMFRRNIRKKIKQEIVD
jgi:hypothetical protein